MKRTPFYLLIIIIIALIIASGINLLMPSYYDGQISEKLNDIKPVQCALVLGASVTSRKEPSAALKERLEKALELYRSGRVQKIIVSGDNSKLYYDEVNVMKNYLLRRRVASKDIFMDHAGINTWNSIVHAKYIFSVKNTIIVTQRYHLTRSLMIADLINLKATGYSADMGLYKYGLMSCVREFFARFKDILHVFYFDESVFHSAKKNNITGDGKSTWNQPD